MPETKGEEGQLIDIDTGVLRRDRLLVQRGPGATVYVGLGRGAERLARFGFDEGSDTDPFIASCRHVAEAIERGDLSKADEFGIPPAAIAIQDRTLRRLAIAEALAKAGFDPDEPRIPVGSGRESGEWTEGDETVVPAADRHQNTQAVKERFVDAHLADTAEVARALGVPVECILGIAAIESGWGESRFAADGNNFFGIHYPAPFASGYLQAARGPAEVDTFTSYADSLRSFVATAGAIIRGKVSPTEFAAALQDAGKFGIDPDTGGKKPSYVRDTAATIRGLGVIVSRRGF